MTFSAMFILFGATEVAIGCAKASCPRRFPSGRTSMPGEVFCDQNGLLNQQKNVFCMGMRSHRISNPYYIYNGFWIVSKKEIASQPSTSHDSGCFRKKT